MEEALIALLLANAGVSARLGLRIYFGRKPQSDTSNHYAVAQVISLQRDYVMAGSAGYVASRVQIDVYGQTYKETKLSARAIDAALSGYSGGIFQGVFTDTQRDLDEMDAGDVNPLFRVSTDYIIHHTE
jgi:hypothetical protein